MDNDQHNTDGTDVAEIAELEDVRQAIAQIQGLELTQHSQAYDQIHQKLEDALRLIDGI